MEYRQLKVMGIAKSQISMIGEIIATNRLNKCWIATVNPPLNKFPFSSKIAGIDLVSKVRFLHTGIGIDLDSLSGRALSV